MFGDAVMRPPSYPAWSLHAPRPSSSSVSFRDENSQSKSFVPDISAVAVESGFGSLGANSIPYVAPGMLAGSQYDPLPSRSSTCRGLSMSESVSERLRKYQACDTSLTLGAERGSDSQALLQGGKYEEAFPAMPPAGTHDIRHAGSLQYLEIVHERLSESLPVREPSHVQARPDAGATSSCRASFSQRP